MHSPHCLRFTATAVPVGARADRHGGTLNQRREVQNLKRVCVHTVSQSPKHRVWVVTQALISKSTNWNINVWQSQLLARAYPALLLTAPQTADKPYEEATEISYLFQGISCPHFTPLHHTAPFTSHTTEAYGLPNLGQLDPRLKQILQRRYIPSHSWQLDPKLHFLPLQDREAPWKLYLKWGAWLRLEPLSRTAPANRWTLTSSLIFGQSVHKTKLTQKYYQNSSSALLTRSMYFQRTWVVLLQCFHMY